MGSDRTTPTLGISHDGVYPRCVWCNGENYMPAVIEYSRGDIPCASVNNCGKYLPKDYVRLKDGKKSGELEQHQKEVEES